MNKKKVKLIPYDQNAPKYFVKEKSLLEKNLGDDCEINHVGSTAVPWLAGKGFIDILILTTDKKTNDKIFKKLKSLGYLYSGYGGDEYRIFLKRYRYPAGKKIQIHIHLMRKDEDKYDYILKFRDYLRTHPKEAKKYAEMKIKWATDAKFIREKYRGSKQDYVDSVLAKAKRKGIPRLRSG